VNTFVDNVEKSVFVRNIYLYYVYKSVSNVKKSVLLTLTFSIMALLKLFVDFRYEGWIFTGVSTRTPINKYQ
jgi:hypothetical protein